VAEGAPGRTAPTTLGLAAHGGTVPPRRSEAKNTGQLRRDHPLLPRCLPSGLTPKVQPRMASIKPQAEPGCSGPRRQQSVLDHSFAATECWAAGHR
jgi:hypothetical protein